MTQVGPSQADIEQAILDAYQATFSTEAGKIVLGHLVARFHVATTHYRHGPGATQRDLAFAEGERNVVLGIITLARGRLDAESAVQQLDPGLPGF
jgi:hypothetical protein